MTATISELVKYPQTVPTKEELEQLMFRLCCGRTGGYNPDPPSLLEIVEGVRNRTAAAYEQRLATKDARIAELEERLKSGG